MLFEQGLLEEEYQSRRCWKDKKELSIWNLCERGRLAVNDKGLLRVEVIIVTASDLQVNKELCWVHRHV
jgi:hypothetical protein